MEVFVRPYNIHKPEERGFLYQQLTTLDLELSVEEFHA
jgi:hypothetical protein